MAIFPGDDPFIATESNRLVMVVVVIAVAIVVVTQ